MEDPKRGAPQMCNARRQMLREEKPCEVDSDQPDHASTECGIKVVVFCERLGRPVQKTDRALQPDETTRRNTRAGARAPRMIK